MEPLLWLHCSISARCLLEYGVVAVEWWRVRGWGVGVRSTEAADDEGGRGGGVVMVDGGGPCLVVAAERGKTFQMRVVHLGGPLVTP